MLDLRYSTRFKKDFKTCCKRHYDLNLLKTAIDILQIPALLPPEYKDHSLEGNYSIYRECHLEPDWLLIYRYVNNELNLYRTGTHSDLFGI